MKIAVIGAGSSYTPELFTGLLEFNRVLKLKTLALMDIDKERLEIMAAYLQRLKGKAAFSLEQTTGLEKAVSGADFVILQIRVGGQRARLLDEKIPLKYNCLGQETTGAGGFSLALRTIPVVEKIAGLIEKISPQATLINFTNPSGLITSALLRKSSLKVFGLCNIPLVMQERLAKALKLPPDELELSYFGLNHLSFISELKFKGKSLFEKALSLYRDKNFPKKLLWNLKLIPSPYLFYYYFTQKAMALQKKQKLRAEKVMEIEKSLFLKYRDKNLRKKPVELKKRGGHLYSVAAVELLTALTSPQERKMVLNVENQGSMPELSPEKVVETEILVSSSGIKRQAAKILPPQVKGLIQQVSAYEELTLAACEKKDFSLGVLALLNHPLVADYRKAKGLMKEILVKHAKYLPGWH